MQKRNRKAVQINASKMQMSMKKIIFFFEIFFILLIYLSVSEQHFYSLYPQKQTYSVSLRDTKLSKK